MSTEKAIVFTDLAGSTRATTERGNEGYVPIAARHIEVAVSLLQHSSGKYVKSEGDANMAAFDDFEDAVKWAVRLLQYHDEANQPSIISGFAHRLKVGMALGTVEEVTLEEGRTDYLGAGVDEAARVQGQSAEGQLLVNEAMFNALGRHWGPDKRNKYLKTVGLRPQKGLDPEDRELFEVDWRAYAADVPTAGLKVVITSALDDAGVTLADFSPSWAPGLIIWPVVPRRRVTAIHRAQALVIRLLCLLGWSPTLLIADCSSPQTVDSKVDSATFCKELQEFCKSEGFRLSKIERLSKLWSTDNVDHDRLQEIFSTITSELSFHDLQLINSKQDRYEPKDIEEVNQRPTLDNLRPALSGAAVTLLAARHSGATVVVAGADEAEQWRRVTSSAAGSAAIGRAMIPVLKVDHQYVARQHGEFPSWDSVQSLQRDLETGQGNLASWVFHCHVLLPRFPARKVEFEGFSLGRDWQCEDTVCPEDLKMRELARLAWNVLGSA
jgi:hypothetical protein